MSTALLGSGTFQDLYAPAKGKSEWGMDTLTRKMEGARSLLPAFIASLAQGQLFQGYYLQTWEPDDSPNVATVTLNYKGLLTGGTPVPDVQTEITPAVGSCSRHYGTENGGLGRVYKKVVMWKYWFEAVGTGSGIVSDELVGYRDVYTTGATMEFTYDAVQSVYRYIKVGKPNAPQFSEVDIGYTPVLKKKRIITADGSLYGNNAPAVFSDLVPIVINRLVGFVSKHVIGTPYYECEDVVRAEFSDPLA